MTPAAAPAAARDDDDVVVRVRGVHYAASGHKVFDGLDLDIRRGQVTAIMGPSGTGKTTLLRLITGQIRADRGEVVVDGRDVATLRRRELYALRQRMGRAVGTEDCMIAGIARQHGATVVTRDAGGFEGYGVPVITWSSRERCLAR